MLTRWWSAHGAMRPATPSLVVPGHGSPGEARFNSERSRSSIGAGNLPPVPHEGVAPRFAYSEDVAAHQVGYLSRSRRRGELRRPARIPILHIVVEPGGSIDFAHPDLGFPGHHHRPPVERILRLWRDDVLTVEHAAEWRFVVHSPIAFDRRWLALLERAARARREPALAAVFASFSGPALPGPFHLAEVDATTYTTLVHVEDRREPTRQCRRHTSVTCRRKRTEAS